MISYFTHHKNSTTPNTRPDVKKHMSPTISILPNKKNTYKKKHARASNTLNPPRCYCETVKPFKRPCCQTKSLGLPNVGMTIHTTDAIASRFMSWKIDQGKRMDNPMANRPSLYISKYLGKLLYQEGYFWVLLGHFGVSCI